MAKLKCDAHDRRVLTVNSRFLHRTGDMSKCSSSSATLGTRTYAININPHSPNSGKLELIDDTKFNPEIHTPPKKNKKRK